MTDRSESTDGHAMPGVPGGDDEEPDTTRNTRNSTPGETSRDGKSADPTSSDDDSTGSRLRTPGVPKVRGTADTGSQTSTARERSDGETCGAPEHASTETVHDLTTVFTFRALQRVADPKSVIGAARSWSDWVGLVGEVDVPTMNTFLRRTGTQVDFFNGASSPEARLRKVSETDSTFGSERQVLIGLEGQEGHVEGIDWEFQSLEDVATDAGWTV